MRSVNYDVWPLKVDKVLLLLLLLRQIPLEI
jgi:hypothetical protein